MDFRAITVAPAGRNKYGTYISAGNVTKSVINTTYGGNNTTTTIGDTGSTEEGEDNVSFYCMLSKPNVTIDAENLAAGAMEYTTVIAYRGYDKAPTLICDMSKVSAITNSDGIVDSIEVPADSGVTNVPEGMTFSITDNGTTGATFVINATSQLTGTTGTIGIPVVIYKRDKAVPVGDDVYDWWDSMDDCEQVWLDFTWSINRAATGNYTLDLSNQTAQVNCDSAGTLYPNSIATLQCTAVTYYNGAIDQNVTYSVSTTPSYLATGFSINAQTGVLTFNSAGTKFNWSAAYPALPINIIASKEGSPIAQKTMTIARNYPGSDGTPAHTRYINTSAGIVVFDPETSGFTPTSVTGTVWLQVGNELPVVDNQTTIYQWYNDMETGKTSAHGTITANLYLGVSAITFGLKNDDNQYYELEDVPVIPKGTQGPAGPSGATGPSGDSAWYLTLSNDNASINCDSDGNILPGAVKPSCQAKLYHGAVRQTNATYAVDLGGATGVTTATTNGVLTLTFGSNFNFNTDTLSIIISGYGGDVATYRDTKIMNVTKTYAGENGDDAINYWLEVSYGEVIYDPNTKLCSPETITVSGYKQIGQQAVIPAADATIKYRWQNRSTGSLTPETAYTSAIQITSARCESYSRLRFTMYVGNTQVDMEDVDILKNGIDGTAQEGRRGAAIRGPYSWEEYSASTRCWCAGESGGSCTECEKWIDVILKDGIYYYCNTTYYGKLSPWNNVKNYWTTGDTFDFVASQLLLAENGKIRFLTNNELYLQDSDGNITAGAAGGDGINFWAGSDSPADAPFTVSNDGTMVATQGTFGPFTIGTDTAGNSALKGSSSAETYDNFEKHEMYLNPDNIHFVGTVSSSTYSHTETISIVPSRDPDKYDGNGVIEIAIADKVATDCGDMEKEYSDSTAFYTNGTMVAHAYNGEGRTRGIGGFGQAVMSPLKGIEITFMTTASTNFARYGTWFINGVDTTISAAEPQTLFTKTSFSNYDVWYFDGKPLTSYGVCIPYSSSYNFTTGGTQTWHFNGKDLGFATTNYSRVGTRTSSSTFGTASDIGYWMVYNTSGAALNTGIANPNYITKRNNVIYIEV